MINNVKKGVLGIGGKSLRAIADSTLKRFPVQSDQLEIDQKLSVSANFQIRVQRCKIIQNHYAFETDDARFLGKGYASLEHFELIGDENQT
jgi:hypothetical protein